MKLDQLIQLSVDVGALRQVPSNMVIKGDECVLIRAKFLDEFLDRMGKIIEWELAQREQGEENDKTN